MKKLFFATCFLISFTTFAQPNLKLPLGAKVVPATAKPSDSVKAILICNLYKTRVAGEYFLESELLATKKSDTFDLGTGVFLAATFPAPFDDATVYFNHVTVGYGESGMSNVSPYIQAFLSHSSNSERLKDTTFEIKNAKTTSKITLRDTFLIHPEVLLSYQCSIEQN